MSANANLTTNCNDNGEVAGENTSLLFFFLLLVILFSNCEIFEGNGDTLLFFFLLLVFIFTEFCGFGVNDGI